jgi:hypothetical protein
MKSRDRRRKNNVKHTGETAHIRLPFFYACMAGIPINRIVPINGHGTIRRLTIKEIGYEVEGVDFRLAGI